MKLKFLILAASLALLAGCERPGDRPITEPAGAPVGQTPDDIDRWAEREKARIEAEADAAKAQFEAQRAREEAEMFDR